MWSEEMDTSHRQMATSTTAEIEAAPVIMVLLVDDQPIIGEAVRRALREDPAIEFHYCSDPNAAVGLAREIKPTVILQDLVMPGVDGLDLVRSYRAEPSIGRTPIVVLSAREEATVKSEAFRAGANDYLVKLPDNIELLARIRYHSAGYLSLRQRDEAYRALRESQQQLMEANIQLQALTVSDPLTGLSNRRFFDEYTEREWSRAMRSGTPMALLIIDIDYFKQYNDGLGHLAGDKALMAIGDIIQSTCRRATDLAARFGGDEFVVAVPDALPSQLRSLAERIHDGIEAAHLPHPGSPISPWVTATIGGVSQVPDRDQSFASFFETADGALYEAKRLGRNSVFIRE
jgi:two-component system chemotaxis family response regulator WspR